MRNYPVNILKGADNISVTGSSFFVGQAVAASFTNVFGDTGADGSIKIQGSNDIPVGDPTQFVPTNWNDIPSASSTIASGVGPAIVLPTMNFQYIRAIYTSVSGGTTTVNVNMSALGV